MSRCVGERIRAAREACGMRQKFLAERAHLSETGLRHIERGLTRYPRLDHVYRIARTLGLSLDALCHDLLLGDDAQED